MFYNIPASTSTGRRCVIPFSYLGQVFYNCTTLNNGNVPWCPFQVFYFSSSEWGNCTSVNCTQPPLTTPAPSPGPNVVCTGMVIEMIGYYNTHTHEDLCARSRYQGQGLVITSHIIPAQPLWYLLLAHRSSYEVFGSAADIKAMDK